MLRRKFIACLAGVAAWPLAVHAQQPNKVRRIGVLELIDDPMIRSVILPELAQRGFVDGRRDFTQRCRRRWGAEWAGSECSSNFSCESHDVRVRDLPTVL